MNQLNRCINLKGYLPTRNNNNYSKSIDQTFGLKHQLIVDSAPYYNKHKPEAVLELD